MTCEQGSCAYFGGGGRSWSATALHMFDAVICHNFCLQIADLVQILFLNDMSEIFLAEHTLLQVLEHGIRNYKNSVSCVHNAVNVSFDNVSTHVLVFQVSTQLKKKYCKNCFHSKISAAVRGPLKLFLNCFSFHIFFTLTICHQVRIILYIALVFP